MFGRKLIYLDNAATTMLDPKVEKAMAPFLQGKFGNASSTHHYGREAKDALESSRKTIAKSIGAIPEEIVFTSGGTESNNFAIKSIAFSNRGKGNHIITTNIEHDCIIKSCGWLESQGFKITYLEVDNEGFLSADSLKKAITGQTLLLSAIHGNNEIGTIQNLDEIGKVCREKGILFHTDACQSFTKAPLDVNKQKLDLVTLNAHKIHGPKGVGALYIRSGTKLSPWQHGGGHEGNMRSGTENVAGIVGFAQAVKQASEKSNKQMMKQRDRLIDGILRIPGSKLNGPIGNNRLCNNANFLFKGVEGEAIGGYLDQKGICTSGASACTANTHEPSHVLQAIGITKQDAGSALRISLSRFTTDQEIDTILQVLPQIIKKLS